MSNNWIFDQQHYQALNNAREPVVRRIASDVKLALGPGKPTAIDVACGLGHYSNVLRSLGFEVLGVDVRKDNVEEARRRYPDAKFEVADAEDPGLSKLGTFDLVFCFGLLYHLENPFRAIRSLSAMTSTAMMVEGICYPSSAPVMVFMDEVESNDQGVNALAYYPSETALVKMLLTAGFPHCYLPVQMPAHPEYQPDDLGFRMRTVLVAAKVTLTSDSLTPWPNPPAPIHPWHKMAPLFPIRGRSGRIHTIIERILHGGMGAR